MAKVAALIRRAQKGGPEESLLEAELLEGLGMSGNFHQGGERQLSLLSSETRVWMDSQEEKGLCFARFKENILLDGFRPDRIPTGTLLSIGNAVIKLSIGLKRCHSECKTLTRGTDCRLNNNVLFASVASGGTVRVGDEVTVLLSPPDVGINI